jgi:glycogen debranching enzyme
MPDTAARTEKNPTEIAAATSEFGSVPISQFYIEAAASLEERRPRTLKHGDTFGVFNHGGSVLSGPASPEGLYHRDMRHLSHLALSFDGMRPLLLSSNLREDNATLTCDLCNPDIRCGDRLILRQDLIHLRRSKFLWQAACYERIALRNYDGRRHHITLTVEFAADFADLFEVRGLRRKRRGTILPPTVGPNGVTLPYEGLDGRRRETRLRFDPAPARIEANRAEFEIKLPHGGRAVVFVEVRCEGPPRERPPRAVFFASMRDARRALRASSSRAASVETSNQIFNEGLRRCVSDLYMLITDQSEGPYPYAGIPWFSTVFGRDALITALFTLWMDPSIARGVLAYLAANQATSYDKAADAEPGKILHEMRQGEAAMLGEVPFRRYYGSVDATPLFLILAGAYLERTGDIGFLRTLWPAIEAALGWIDTEGDRDGDGFVEYGRQTDEGLTNQGWKDSQDSIFHADGKLAHGPIALVEVQAYVFAAKRAAATIARRLGFDERAASLDNQAEMLRQRFEAAFWDEQLGNYVLALDGDKRPCRVASSNAGHALFSGIAAPARAERVGRSLMGGALFSGWGIRTIGSLEARYNPMSYHNGSVWPHDNALIALGFALYGFGRQAAQLLESLFDASIHMDLRRLPELFCGFARQRSQGPTAYPVACSPQAWAATAPLALLQACLGLGFDLANRSITLNRPELPSFLDQVILRGLSLGDARVDVMLRRAAREVAVNVLSRQGDIRVITVS